MNKFNLQQIKTTHLRNTNGLLMNMVTSAKWKLLNVLSVGGLRVLKQKINLVVRYGSKPPELAKGKAGIALEKAEAVVPALEQVKAGVTNGELDALLEGQGFRKPLAK